MHGGGPPRGLAGAAAKAVSAWSDLGRPGRPRLWGMGYFALGDGTADAGAKYLRHYYAFTGPFAEKIAAGNLTSPGAIADFIRGCEDTRWGEVGLFPTVSGIEEIDRRAAQGVDQHPPRALPGARGAARVRARDPGSRRARGCRSDRWRGRHQRPGSTDVWRVLHAPGRDASDEIRLVWQRHATRRLHL